jgi:hypothetical protein
MTEAIERTTPPLPAVRSEGPRRDRDRPSPAPAEPRPPACDPHKGALLDVVV